MRNEETAVNRNFTLPTLDIFSWLYWDVRLLGMGNPWNHRAKAIANDDVNYLLAVIHKCSEFETMSDPEDLLERAAFRGSLNVMRMLLDAGANANKPSILNCAAYSGKIPAIELLVEAGADVQAISHHSNTVLHAATYSDSRAFIEFLLNTYNLPINAVNNYNETALHRAATHNKPNATTALLTAGADVSIKNKKGHTPERCAELNGHHEVARLIKDHASKANLKEKTVKTAQKHKSKDTKVIEKQSIYLPSNPLLAPNNQHRRKPEQEKTKQTKSKLGHTPARKAR